MLPIGWKEDFKLKAVKKGATMAKKYLINKIMDNAEYGHYVQDEEIQCKENF